MRSRQPHAKCATARSAPPHARPRPGGTRYTVSLTLRASPRRILASAPHASSSHRHSHAPPCHGEPGMIARGNRYGHRLGMEWYGRNAARTISPHVQRTAMQPLGRQVRPQRPRLSTHTRMRPCQPRVSLLVARSLLCIGASLHLRQLRLDKSARRIVNLLRNRERITTHL